MRKGKIKMKKSKKTEYKLLYLAVKYNGAYSKILEALQNGETATDEQIEYVLNEVKKKGLNYTTIVSDNYPRRLKENSFPPFVLFYEGNLEIFDKREVVGVVGSQLTNAYGVNATEEFAQDLTDKGYAICNECETTLEMLAIEKSIKGKGAQIIVADNGINYFKEDLSPLYNKMHKLNQYLIVSEKLYNASLKKDMYQINSLTCRLVIGMSNYMLFTYIAKKDQYIDAYSLYDINYSFIIPCGIDDKNAKNNIWLKNGELGEIATSTDDICLY